MMRRSHTYPLRHPAGLVRLILWGSLIGLLGGCSAMKIEAFSGNSPKLVPESYFLGSTWAWGIVEDRFGNLRRSFQVIIEGRKEAGNLILDEHFRYADGETDRRIWTITPLGDGAYRGEADDIIGHASGQAAGNALNWHYQMDLPVGDRHWRVQFDDWMYLQPNRMLINKATISKWGLRLGTVTLFFSKQRPQS